MKKIAIVLVLVLIVSLFAACSESEGTTDIRTESFSTADEAFESMTGAIDAGDYQAAIDCYTNGAADADVRDLNSWYYYSLAMKEHTEHGCIGYPLDIIYNRVQEDFELGKTAYGEIQAKARMLDGVYTLNNNYIYISDGKIACSQDEKLTGIVFCDSEVALNDDVFTWVMRNSDGTHTTLYVIEYTEAGIKLTAAEGNENPVFAGEFAVTATEFPELCY